MLIKKVTNGYVITKENGQQEIYKTLQEVCECMLALFEGRGRYFGGDSFGRVVILTEPTGEFPEIDPA